jgi:antitoxin component YwqK of YwqJK toxin-antitoxin module
MIRQKISILAILTCFGRFAYAQTDDIEALFKINYDTPLTIDLDGAREEIVPVTKKKKEKPNIFFGVKTRKLYTRTGFGDNLVFELFNVMKVYEGPPEYAQDFYWYDYKKKKIVNSLRVDPKSAAVLHGPYRKMLGEQVLEEGFFYKGMKHRRWVRYNRFDILQDKEYFWKGWPKDSKLAYWDFNRAQLREVIPVKYGSREGEYWAFYPSGKVAARGKFQHDQKVGIWREYYENRRIKREIYFPDAPFEKVPQGYILKEWDENGQLIYDRAEFLKSL